MSTDSLTPPPTSTSPFRPVTTSVDSVTKPPSPAHRAQDARITRRGSNATTAPVMHEDTAFNASAGPSIPAAKRPRPASPRHSPNKRVRTRSATPIPAENESITTSVDVERAVEVDQTVSAGYGTTLAGPSSYARMEYIKAEDEAGQTSETDSVLFSEQVDTQQSQVSGSTAAKGHLGDYIPQPDPTMVPPTEETGDSRDGSLRTGDVFEAEEEEDAGVDDGEQEMDPEEGNEMLEESHDDQDDDDNDDEDAAATPKWLTDQHTLIAERRDAMTRVIEGREGIEVIQEQVKYAGLEGQEAEDEEESDDGPFEHSYHSGDTEDYEMDHRPVLERTAIKRDIRHFTESLSSLRDATTGEIAYKVVDRLGEGTFSSVYLAHDVFHHHHDNFYWTDEPDELPRKMIPPSRSNMPVALKKILVTSSPTRIENELHILESLRGCRNVSKLVTAFREDDQVIIVMPYHVSDDFRHFYRHMDTWAMRNYMRNLMRALKDIHARGIIHRDVKPANFLYHYHTAKGVLCDFGLAERYHPPPRSTCQHAPATLQDLHGKRTKTNETAVVEKALYDARRRSKLGEGRIGFSSDDKRPAIKTNRAGTRGFRAPEVLLKCPDQTVSIDIWSAGVILLSILTHKFPCFNSNDDTEALLEIAAIFGRNAMERCSLLHNRTIMSNVPSVDTAPESLTTVILRLNPHIYTPPLSNPSRDEAAEHIIAIDDAVKLCEQMLRLDATKRITAAASLRHPFLAVSEGDEGWKEDMDKVEAISVLEGKCGHLHGIEGSKHRAFFGGDLLDLQFGQGLPAARTKLCPEHEHWQQRTDSNVLATSSQYGAGATEDLETTPKADRTDRDRTLLERDINVESKRRAGKA